MGQKCPCYNNKSTEDHTFFYSASPNEPKSFKNKKYEELISKSKNQQLNSTAAFQDENETHNNQFGDDFFDKVKLLQRFFRKLFFNKKKRPAYEEERKRYIEEKRNLFTSSSLLKADQKYPSLNLVENLALEPTVLVNTDGIVDKDCTSLYCGQLNLQGQKHGKGSLVLENGTKYEGLWKEGEFLYGRFIDQAGAMLEGYFTNGKVNGLGTYMTLDDYVYEGNFLDNERSGIGKEETPQHTYDGEFKNSKKHGHGKQIFKLLGDIFIGEFRDDKMNGSGMYIFKNGEKYNGEWEDGKMHGHGTYTWPDGSEYNGEYMNNLKHGYGIFKMNTGKIYEGSFFEGKPHGKGKLTSSKGGITVVEYSEGKLMRKNYSQSSQK